MPEMDGVELFRAARREQPNLCGVFLTGYPNINTIFPAIDAGIERVLPKPLDAAELIRLARELTTQSQDGTTEDGAHTPS